MKNDLPWMKWQSDRMENGALDWMILDYYKTDGLSYYIVPKHQAKAIWKYLNWSLGYVDQPPYDDEIRAILKPIREIINDR